MRILPEPVGLGCVGVLLGPRKEGLKSRGGMPRAFDCESDLADRGPASEDVTDTCVREEPCEFVLFKGLLMKGEA